MTDNLPKATWEGTFDVGGGVVMRCYVLDDGRRIVNSEDVAAFLDMKLDKPPSEKEVRELLRFTEWLKRG